MTQTKILHFFVPNNPLLLTTLLMCFFNYSLFVMFSHVHRDDCPENDEDIQQTRTKRSAERKDHWKISEENQYWLVEMAKYTTFNWETEMKRMFDLIPVLEIRTDEKDAPDTDPSIAVPPDDPHQWGRNFTKSPKLPLVTVKTKEQLIAVEVERLNKELKHIYKYENGIKSEYWEELRENGMKNKILGCKDIARLEKSHSEVRIKYNFRTFSHWKGELKISNTNSIPIAVKRYERRKSPPKAGIEKMNYLSLARHDQKPYFDKGFEHAKNEILNMLKLQGWYGIPRILGLCVSSQNGEDITQAFLDKKEAAQNLVANTLRYLVSRHDEDVTKLCTSHIADFQCDKIHNVMGLLHKAKNRPLAAMKIMRNTALLFEQFWKNRVIIYDLLGKDFLIDSNYDIMLTELSTVKFLPHNEYSLHSQVHRLLAGTICTGSTHCPAMTWQANSLSYKFGFHCAEVRGYCTLENRCWGVDSSVHACLLSRWFFLRLRAVIPANWKHNAELSNILQCGSVQTPDQRCSWTKIRKAMEHLYVEAQKSWPPE